MLVYKTAARALDSDPSLRSPIEYQAILSSDAIATQRHMGVRVCNRSVLLCTEYALGQ
jgi:hypothetical protein